MEDTLTPSPVWDGGNRPETRPGIKSPKGRDVVSNLPALAGTLAMYGEEEVRLYRLLRWCFGKKIWKNIDSLTSCT